MPSHNASTLKVRNISYFGAILAYSVVQPVAGSGQAGEPPIDHSRAAAFFEEARELDEANPWAGQLYGPILFVEPQSRYVVANEADSDGTLRAVDSVFAGMFPESEAIANTAITWAGKRWTMVLWPLPSGYFERRQLVGHELFHRLGPELGLPMASPTNAHLETAQGRLWLRLELRALTRALASSGANRQRAVEDALAFRNRRHKAFPEGAVEELALELNEGLAEYTGILVSLPEGSRRGWAVQRMESRERQAGSGGVTRNFAYATGPGYGLLLDAAMPAWHESVDGASDLGMLLARAYSVDVPAVVTTARARMARYEGATVEAFESTREAARVEEQNEFRALYIEGPVLTLPVDEEFRYSFNPNGVAVLDGAGQVYTTARVLASWGTLDVSGGVLMKRNEQGVTAVVVPAPTDLGTSPLSGDGWTLALRDGWAVVLGARAGDLVVQRVR